MSLEGKLKKFWKFTGRWARNTIYGLTAFFCVEGVDFLLNNGLFAQDKGKIVFQRGDNKDDVFIMNPDGTGIKNLTNTLEIHDWYPHLSSDGTKIVYIRDGEIATMNSDGSNVKNLTNLKDSNTWAKSVSWSSHGKKIVFEINPYNILTMNEDGSNEKPIWYGHNPIFSPDSKNILYTIYTLEGCLHLYNLETKNNTTFNQTAVNVSWSSDGKISFDRPNYSGIGDILIANISGNNLGDVTNITNTSNISESHPNFSPDGTQIVFIQDKITTTTTSIFKMNIDGSNQTELTKGGYAHWGGGVIQPSITDLAVTNVKAYTNPDDLFPTAGELSTLEVEIKNIGNEKFNSKKLALYAHVVDFLNIGYDGHMAKSLAKNDTLLVLPPYYETTVPDLNAGESFTEKLPLIFCNAEIADSIFVDLLSLEGMNVSFDLNKENNTLHKYFEVKFNSESYTNAIGEVIQIFSHGATAGIANKAEIVFDLFTSGIDIYEKFREAADELILSKQEVTEELKNIRLQNVGSKTLDGMRDYFTNVIKQNIENFNPQNIPYISILWNEMTGQGILATLDHINKYSFEYNQGMMNNFAQNNVASVAVKSPADLLIKEDGQIIASIDKDGNATGSSNAYGYLIGDKKIALLEQDPNKTYTVELEGTSIGNLDLIVTQIRNGTVVKNEYKDVAVQNNSKGTLEISTQSDDKLEVDLNNNGTIDNIINPEEKEKKTRKIAFASDVDGSNLSSNREIYIMNEDGSNQKRLTFNSVGDFYPSWSPDGSKIAYHSGYKIYVMNADGSNQTRLTFNSLNTKPSWSPDGSKIVFESKRDGNWEIYEMYLDGSNQTRLTFNSVNDRKPSWSPDGSKIVFDSDKDGNQEIYIMAADGSNQKRLTFNPSKDWYPSWSPDGKKIAFTSNRVGLYNDEIYIMNSDGSNQKRLTFNNQFKWSVKPSWSPDGSKIAFFSRRDGNWEIYSMNADGSNQTRLTFNSSHESDPSWSPFLRTSTSIKELIETKLPSEYKLFQNYPNPFNPNTTIEFYVPEISKVELSIYNLLGQEVKTLVNEEKGKGNHSVNWDGKRDDGKTASSGIYLYSLRTSNSVKTKKMLFIK